MKKSTLVFLFLILTASVFAQDGVPPVNDFPNYHPLIVHFPLILLLIAAVMQIALMFFTNKAFNYAVVALTVIGFVTALMSATILHAEPVRNLSPEAKAVFHAHEQYATITLWLSGIASLFKIAGLFFYKKWIEIGALIFLAGSAVTVTIAGHHGAELVYKQGIGPKGELLNKDHDDD